MQQSKRKQRKKGTQNDSTLRNRDNSPYEEQRLKTSFSPYKNRKNSFGENFEGGENKDTQTELKNQVEDTHEEKYSLFQ